MFRFGSDGSWRKMPHVSRQTLNSSYFGCEDAFAMGKGCLLTLRYMNTPFLCRRLPNCQKMAFDRRQADSMKCRY